jgi:hypothetical protein
MRYDFSGCRRRGKRYQPGCADGQTMWRVTIFRKKGYSIGNSPTLASRRCCAIVGLILRFPYPTIFQKVLAVVMLDGTCLTICNRRKTQAQKRPCRSRIRSLASLCSRRAFRGFIRLGSGYFIASHTLLMVIPVR